ncbi:MAG: dihydroorotate dehydrogenase electron transfer subunit [candidate division KSB1 bacterium]|nr:dihydroorotate dehydrogenase electron transfer subunit [candidate division KSB1 bacterium]MDZ7275792.1 dihydroorotate dehydrogenase electron transfer subunit [candidate division KSB1 bacterium]MDZ7287544.1 dihydroorotate dehydrogenase electron transfer subunit [candidate division KSB1 bacterium]MDZ7307970.1 dihydroorotate dehydrogenase electron transfer subunit [candidate division KSB1 bacterium]MDZ7350522.1 dihydroorotate dehydrogenase electron transfer subunit [candidate division KSB1 bact
MIANHEVARGIFLMRLHAPAIAAVVQPGQFVNIQTQTRPVEQLIPLLRRPFSVCQVDRQQGHFTILWKAIGPGTRLLASHRAGTVLSVLGPLGRGFRLPEHASSIALVAGGLGIAPMPMLAAALQQRGFSFEALIGCRTAAELWGAEELQRLGGRVAVATDDGSAGHHGFVTALLQHWLAQPATATGRQVYACGPMAMLAAVAERCRAANLVAQVAVETIMGCGFGICMGCNLEPAQGVQQFGRYWLACLDGPVFDSDRIRYS